MLLREFIPVSKDQTIYGQGIDEAQDDTHFYDWADLIPGHEMPKIKKAEWVEVPSVSDDGPNSKWLCSLIFDWADKN